MADAATDIRFFPLSTPDGPSSRYRVYQFLPFLDAAGIGHDESPLYGPARHGAEAVPSPALRSLLVRGCQALSVPGRLAALRRASGARLAHVERELLPLPTAAAERALARRVPYVLEFDDALFLRPNLGRKYPEILSRASAVIAGNAFLADYARRYNGRVRVVPTVVPAARYAVRRDHSLREGLFRVAWVGLGSNLPSLERIAPALSRLAREVPFRLVAISSRPPRIDGVEVEYHPWSEALDYRLNDLADGGIMPLEDSGWSRGKCGLKLLQYMAAGLPVVASPVGVNGEIVSDGENGLLAERPEEWLGRLLSLARDEGARERLGAAGRRTVEERYSLEAWGGKVAALYGSILDEAGLGGTE
jgi:glycosyltransferase involved in cell wall biosynthesis